MRTWVAKNPGRWREINKAAHQRYDRTEKGKASLKRRRAKWTRSVAGRATLLLGMARRRSTRKGIAFTLTREWLLPLLTPLRCMATGDTLSLEPGSPLVPSIDRKDNTQGYTPDNCWVVSWAFNNRKKAKPLSEL
jgi:hypothetical protein